MYKPLANFTFEKEFPEPNFSSIAFSFKGCRSKTGKLYRSVSVLRLTDKLSFISTHMWRITTIERALRVYISRRTPCTIFMFVDVRVIFSMVFWSFLVLKLPFQCLEVHFYRCFFSQTPAWYQGSFASYVLRVQWIGLSNSSGKLS